MHSCRAITEGLKYLEAHGFTTKQLSSIHHASLKGRTETFAGAYRYFGENKELQDRNLAYASRLKFIVDKYKGNGGTFESLIALALEKWPLR
jgi:hypothetical protein